MPEEQAPAQALPAPAFDGSPGHIFSKEEAKKGGKNNSSETQAWKRVKWCKPSCFNWEKCKWRELSEKEPFKGLCAIKNKFPPSIQRSFNNLFSKDPERLMNEIEGLAADIMLEAAGGKLSKKDAFLAGVRLYELKHGKKLQSQISGEVTVNNTMDMVKQFAESYKLMKEQKKCLP